MDKSINRQMELINNYVSNDNAASASKYDPNANVSVKNIATLSSELNKFDRIMLNRKLMTNKITELFGDELAIEYLRQLNDHEIYTHDETSIKPYCASVNLYPFLFEGLIGMGGDSKAPKNIDSFCGTFINLVFALASQFAGAIATVEFLMYFDYFSRKEWGEDYHSKYKDLATLGARPQTIERRIEAYLQQVVYSLNQPAASRGYQSIFWNISVFDKYYFDSIFGDFVFPDGTSPNWDSLNRLQQKFLSWFNKERTKSLLTFPVVTVALLTENNDVKDEEYRHVVAKELSEGQSMFMYMSESADSLASCCRLRNEIADNTFSYSLGAGGVSTGSINVITMNLNRLVQKNISIEEQVKKIHKYQVAYHAIINDYYEANLLPAYTAGFISLKKQFLTIGVNGLVEAAESKGISIIDSKEYNEFVDGILYPIFEQNKLAKEKYGVMFNTEFVPAENLGVKNAKWDQAEGLKVARDCYNSYFYVVESEKTNPIDKFILHGSKYNKYLDGGSALHLNLDEHLDIEQYKQLLKVAAINKTNYWTVNVKNTVCNDCDYIDKSTHTKCPKCGSTNIDYATRVIGYLKRVKSFSKDRQTEEHVRAYSHEIS
ncbi:anaerobic ribonucleoside triphosphate reductase [Candidatus Izimaplasma bacterium HR1]|jgi:ribonucleoside-triphosphate reductase|uniref:anaerobic ribonucleoside-triphosphate reductase n=1 Tax=Candidatus Izimoplasma sp. HR1 TaxID=1541959 RepID=UPI0004F5C518|nr:anaerobic ribonucleoside triphosphate reductase [Candidatus Izimaplasma bacterium HR1]